MSDGGAPRSLPHFPSDIPEHDPQSSQGMCRHAIAFMNQAEQHKFLCRYGNDGAGPPHPAPRRGLDGHDR